MAIKINYLKVHTKEIEGCEECPYFEHWDGFTREYACEVEYLEHYYDSDLLEDLLEYCPFNK